MYGGTILIMLTIVGIAGIVWAIRDFRKSQRKY